MAGKMLCEKCGKRLSRKTARTIDGKTPLCSACMFAPHHKSARITSEGD